MNGKLTSEEWLIAWRLAGRPTTLSLEMLATIPDAALWPITKNAQRFDAYAGETRILVEPWNALEKAYRRHYRVYCGNAVWPYRCYSPGEVRRAVADCAAASRVWPRARPRGA